MAYLVIILSVNHYNMHYNSYQNWFIANLHSFNLQLR